MTDPATILATLREVAARQPHRHTRPLSDDEIAHQIHDEARAEARRDAREYGSDRDSDHACDVAERLADRTWE